MRMVGSASSSNAYYAAGAKSNDAADATGTSFLVSDPAEATVSRGTDGNSSDCASRRRPKLTLVVKLTDVLKPINIAELPEDQYQMHMEAKKRFAETYSSMLERQYTEEPSAPTTPLTQPYASIVVGGKVVATVDNQGLVISDNSKLSKSLRERLQALANGASGPKLAQACAEEIAKSYGGWVEKAGTAISQREFSALVSRQQAPPAVDYEAMKQDPRYQEIQDMLAGIESLTQQRQAYLAGPQAGVDVVV